MLNPDGSRRIQCNHDVAIAELRFRLVVGMACAIVHERVGVCCKCRKVVARDVPFRDGSLILNA